MNETMRSPTIGALAKALVKVQAELKGPVKSKTNPHFRSKYADLEGYLEAALPVFTKHGLCVLQLNIPFAGGVGLETVILHESGEWTSGTITMEVKDPTNPQAIGSAQSYARRYGLAAAGGMAAEDDDGNEGANGQGRKPETRALPPVGKPKTTPKGDLERELQRPPTPPEYAPGPQLGGWSGESPLPVDKIPRAGLPAALKAAQMQVVAAGGNPGQIYPHLVGLKPKEVVESMSETALRGVIEGLRGVALKLEREKQPA